MARQFLANPAAVEVPIEVVGSDLDGRQYVERTRTLSITRDGATILLANKLAPESELIIHNLRTNEEVVVRVVGHIREDIAGHVYGVTFLHAPDDLWRVPDLPPASLNSIVLECSRCHVVKLLSLTEIEMEVFQSKRALTRRCECGVACTIWKETTREVTVGKKESSPQPPAEIPEREERKHKRTAIKALVCIRCSGREELAECEDMSRGGFRFRSRKRYPAGTRIEAAVPFVPGSTNIFVPGEIAYHLELTELSHRHGVAYLITGSGPGYNDREPESK